MTINKPKLQGNAVDITDIKKINHNTETMQQYISECSTLVDQEKTSDAIGQLLEIAASLVNQVQDLKDQSPS